MTKAIERAGTAGLTRRLERVKPHLVCPCCKSDLDFTPAAAQCVPCKRLYPIVAGRIHFLKIKAEVSDTHDRLKAWLKHRLGRYYYTVGVDLIAPNYPFNFAREITKHVDPVTKLVLDIGSGNMRLHDDIICIDIFDYDAVDILCDVAELPFRDGSVDACVSRSMLEHVPDPWHVVREFHRVTKVGGVGVHLIPFLMPFHASPYDFHRFTDRGAALLFKDFEVAEQRNPTGPVSTLLNVLIEFLSALLSLGSPKARALLYLALCGLLFPIKFLDFPFVNRGSFLTLAASILTVVRKRAER